MQAGRSAILLEVADLAEALALRRGLHAVAQGTQGSGIVELVSAARTVLVHFDESLISGPEVAELAATVDLAGGESAIIEFETIETTYDGDDLESVCCALDLSVSEFVEWHTSVVWQVAFTGFAPGFAYLASESHSVPMPRLENPRTSVPAGSVAMADIYTGVYPAASPGGWQLVGRTDRVLFDVELDPPSVLKPGTGVRFIEA